MATLAEVRAKLNNMKNVAQTKISDARIFINDKVTELNLSLAQSRQSKLTNTQQRINDLNAGLQALQKKQAWRATYINYAKNSWNPFVKFKGWRLNKAYNRDIKKENKLSADLSYYEAKQNYLATKFKNKYGAQFDFVGRETINGLAFSNDKSSKEMIDIRRRERNSIIEKNKNKDAYYASKSNLDKGVIFSADGKYKGEYSHYNSIDNTVELDYSKPKIKGVFTPNGIKQTTVSKFEIKLNENREIDLSLPENKAILSDKDTLKDLLKEYPEAYKTIPAQAFDKTFGGRLERNEVLDYMCEGVKNKISKGSGYVEYPAKDDKGNLIGRKATAQEYVEDMFKSVIDKDNELYSYSEKHSYSYQKRLTEMKLRAQAAQSNINNKDIQDFFDRAK